MNYTINNNDDITIKEALIKNIYDCDNVIKVHYADSDKTLEIRGDDVDTDLREGRSYLR